MNTIKLLFCDIMLDYLYSYNIILMCRLIKTNYFVKKCKDKINYCIYKINLLLWKPTH